jgi:acyl dehydratase
MVDRSIVGRRFTPVHAIVEAGRLRAFFNTLKETNPVYRDPEQAAAAGYAGVPIPPTYLFCLEMMDAENSFEFLDIFNVEIGRVLHGEQRFAYHLPVVVGDRLTFDSVVTDVVDKKNGAMTLITVTTAVTNQRAERVADTTRTVVILNR